MVGAVNTILGFPAGVRGLLGIMFFFFLVAFFFECVHYIARFLGSIVHEGCGFVMMSEFTFFFSRCRARVYVCIAS